jgi:dienelactone hydrolase
MNSFAPETRLFELMDEHRSLAFDPKGEFRPWRKSLKSKLLELLGKKPVKVKPNLRIEYENDCGEFLDRRFVFSSETHCDVPCHLLLPKTQGRHPVMICLQGHSTGMHLSLGRCKYPGDENALEGGRDFALQAVRQGFAALAIEQRCFGERADARPEEARSFHFGCHNAAMGELLLGRTMMSLRVWDVSRAIDAITEFEDVDLDRIACMGNSGGGTVTYYAACIDDRIKAAMPSCSVCTYKDSIGSIDHCVCNFIPGVMNFFDMGDLAGLIAPKSLVVVAGEKDPIFPIAAVKRCFETVAGAYEAEGHPENCRLVVGPEGHQFYPELAWPVFRDLVKW